MGHSQNRRVFRKSLRLEALERREVFASDMLISDYYVNDLVDRAPEAVDPLDNYLLSKSYNFVAPPNKFETVTTAADFDAKLKSLVEQHWKDVFGKQPSELPGGTYNGYPYGFYALPALTVSDTALAPTSGFASVRSLTNTRHDLVDEGDMLDITSDGYLYSAVGTSLHVTNLSDPANLSTKSLFDLVGYSANLIVSGDSLIIVQQEIPGRLRGEFFNASFHQSKTRVSQYDISDRLAPREVSNTLIDGSNYSVRFSDGRLTLVQSHQNSLPKPVLVTDTSGTERYESLDRYYANNRDAIVAALQPDYVQSVNAQTNGTRVDAGSWDDLSFANGLLNFSTSIMRFDLDDSGLTLTDSETITGMTPNLVYQGLDDIYLVTIESWADANMHSRIYRVDATDDGQLKSVGAATVKGRVSDSTWLNEHNGVLQVASFGNLPPAHEAIESQGIVAIESQAIVMVDRWFTFPVSNTANITTIGDTAEGWKVLGTLEDIGDGQGLLAASFIGDRAMITTGTPLLIDPLHGIDLSDPENPVELSEVVIPGFTTYLMQIDDSHWLGFGYDQNAESRTTVIQVSLYEGSDLTDPALLDRWTLENAGGGRIWDPHSISYDPDTGLLVMSAAQQWNLGGNSRLPLLKVDVNAEDPLSELGGVSLLDYSNRSFTIGDVLVVTTAHSVTTYDVGNLAESLGKAFYSNYDLLSFAYWTVESGGTRDWRLADQWTGEPFVITNIETSGPITATLQSDQSTITLSAPAGDPVDQSAKVTVRFLSGGTHTVNVTLRAGGYPIDMPVNPPVYSAGRASIEAEFTDDEGNVLTDLSAGDEVWVTVSLTDGRENAIGVFGAYVDVAFLSGNVTVIGQLEYLDFHNGKQGSISSSGIESFGGFGDGQLPDSPTSQLGRFKIRVENDTPVTINITPSIKRNEEVLMHQLERGLDPANVSSVMLTTQLSTLRTTVTAENREQDVNADGMITALDVLQVVNYINDRNSAAAESVASLATSQNESVFDISGDGIVSAVDVLQIVNTINARFSAPASGEGGSLNAAAVDQLLAVDLDSIVKKK